MKRVIILWLAIIPMYIFGQSLSVTNFTLAENDLTALNEKTKFIDENGYLCALLKVETTERGFIFDGGTIGVAKVDDTQPGEIWVYVPADLKRITIRHQKLGVLRDYYFPFSLQRGKTYIMRLVSAKTVTNVQAELNMQYLVINYTPKEAMVEIDGEIVEGENGVAMKRVKFGKHTFRVSMSHYHPESGQVMVDNPNARVEQTVTLKPAYGWIKLIENATNRDATVYIDNKMCGHIPFKSNPLASGQHDVRVVKSKYLSYREQVFVTDGNITEVMPSLMTNYETVTFWMDGTPEVWVNNEKIGDGNCTVDLEPGEYVVETRLPGHRPQSIAITVTIGNKVPITLPSPTPIYGGIDISSKPYNSTIYLDGNKVGTSPLFLQQVLIGEHKIEIKAEGKESLVKSITVKEGETVSIEDDLKDKKQAIKSSNSGNGNGYYSGSSFGNKSGSNYGNNGASYTYTKNNSTGVLQAAKLFVGITINYSNYKFTGEDEEIPSLDGFSMGLVIQSVLYKNLVLWWGAEYQFAMSTQKENEEWKNHNIKVPFRLGVCLPFGKKSSFTIFGGPSLDFNVSTTNEYMTNNGTVKVDFVSGKYTQSNSYFPEQDDELKLLKYFDIPLGIGVMYKYGKFGIKFQYEWGMLNRYHDDFYTEKANQFTAGILLHF